jgi:hypothetical protein
MPLNRRSKAKSKDFTCPATGTRSAGCKKAVCSVYGGCRKSWWNRELKKEGVVPPENSRVHKRNKELCARVAWASAKKRGLC